MEDKILKDNPIIYKEQLTKKCKKGYYKGSMVTDPGNTFHFIDKTPTVHGVTNQVLFQ